MARDGAPGGDYRRGRVIVCTDVSKRYQGRTAVSAINLLVPAERCVALVGPSGSGKSTLLRLVLGLMTPDSGSIAIAGEPMVPASARALRLRMGYVIQDGGLFPHLTAEENALLVARHVGWTGDRMAARLANLTELAGLSAPLMTHYPAELSGGERQRVGLVRALMLDPPVLLLDEPLGALDPIIRSRLQDDLKRIFQSLKKTVLLVTHDLDEAAYLGDEVAVMHDGTMVQKGPMRDLAEHPADPFVTEFLRAQRPRWSGIEST